ncbi:MAG: glycosyltransferase family 39 protein [Candidatus Bathyarchaeota archaeon]|nr:glycosyltransferase family 39 protein [Candidatus Bathyarchaeota archaeon]
MNKNTLQILLGENYPLFSIMLGALLVSITLGPFQNFDTQLEYEAASGVIKWGMPYMKYYGDMINQPPLGFYIEALFFKLFGLSFNNGVLLITLFSLGCIFLVFQIGKTLYGKSTGLLAAALFAFTPWHFVLSRSFLIDVPCLFFSLLCLLVGIHAIRRDSEVLFMASSILFAVALLTKFFAVFVLIPLALFYISHRQKKLSHIFTVAAYFLPTLIVFFLWYDVIWGRGLLYGESHTSFTHDDFVNFNPANFKPSYFFVGTFLIEAVGIFFLIAFSLSLIVYVFCRDSFTKLLSFDMMCLATSIAVIAVNTFLGAGLNLSFPYNNAIKYNYQALPYLSLLSASLLPKSVLIYNSLKSKKKRSLLLFSIAAVGIALLGLTLLVNMHYINYLSTIDHLVFKVDINRSAGYSFVNSAPITDHFSIAIQYLGFALALSGLTWATRNKIAAALKLITAVLKSPCSKESVTRTISISR